MSVVTQTFPSITPSGSTVGYGALVLTHDTENPQEVTCGFGLGEGQEERKLSLSTLKTVFEQNDVPITEGDTYVKVHRLFLFKVISFIVEETPAIILAGPVHKFIKNALKTASTIQSA
jgi:hypothetical protein